MGENVGSRRIKNPEPLKHQECSPNSRSTWVAGKPVGNLYRQPTGTQGITTGLCSVSNSKFGGTSESFGWFYNSNIPNVGCLHVYIYYFHHSWNFRISTDQPNLFVFPRLFIGVLLFHSTSASDPSYFGEDPSCRFLINHQTSGVSPTTPALR